MSTSIIGGLFIDMGQQLKNGTWKKPPRARYGCVTCGYQSEIVTGAAAVKTFVSHIRTTHRATCPATTNEGAHAA